MMSSNFLQMKCDVCLRNQAITLIIKSEQLVSEISPPKGTFTCPDILYICILCLISHIISIFVYSHIRYLIHIYLLVRIYSVYHSYIYIHTTTYLPTYLLSHVSQYIYIPISDISQSVTQSNSSSRTRTTVYNWKEVASFWKEKVVLYTI